MLEGFYLPFGLDNLGTIRSSFPPCLHQLIDVPAHSASSLKVFCGCCNVLIPAVVSIEKLANFRMFMAAL